MEPHVEEVELHSEWAENLDHGALPHEFTAARTHCVLPPGLAKLSIKLGISEWPDGREHHIRLHLDDRLDEVLIKGAHTLGKPLLPAAPEEPFDKLRARRGHGWTDPLDLDTPLWLALAEGISRHFGIEYKLTVRINAKWGVASSPSVTPRQLLTAFGFEPSEFSLYPAHSAQLLPPDQPLNLHRGDHFEAQKDGKYGLLAAPSRGFQTIEEDVEINRAAGMNLRLLDTGGQRYVETRDLEIPSPPWSGPRANILIAAPSTYPNGGLDAFYLETTVNQGGSIPRRQSTVAVDGREWALISWHYADGHAWNPMRDDLASHIAHCRGFFLQRGIR